jgi:membrane associated rhomboid family serine protease
MRDPYHGSRMTTKLIIVLIVAFVIQSLLVFYWDFDVLDSLALSVNGISRGKVWQLLTFQFLHSTPMPWHVLFNCLGLYFFGRPVEEALGGKRFLSLYFLSGTMGGLLQVLLTLILPRHEDIPVVGASAGVCGMIAIFCTLYPMQELTTWIAFFPINIRARYLLIFLTLLSLFGAFVPFDGIAHAAHLGGILTGIVYVRWGTVIGDRFDSLKGRLTAKKAAPVGVRLRSWGSTREKSKPISRGEEFISNEVDPILDKISAQGFQSLTERERKILDDARKKMS